MENRKLSFGYEDTDKKIEMNLYGLDFEIKNLDSVEEFKKLDRNDNNAIEAQLEKILGEGAIDKINKKRLSDGYSELDLSIELNILGCIFETYAKSMTDNVLGKVTNAIDEMDNKVNNVTNINREQRRNYNRNNRGYRRNYRRY